MCICKNETHKSNLPHRVDEKIGLLSRKTVSEEKLLPTVFCLFFSLFLLNFQYFCGRVNLEGQASPSEVKRKDPFVGLRHTWIYIWALSLSCCVILGSFLIILNFISSTLK